jgi:hypothetical protein
MLNQVQRAVQAAGGQFQVERAVADSVGRVESLNIVSPQDHSALEIEYLSADEVADQVAALATDVRASASVDRAKLDRLPQCDAGFEVMHFEEMTDNFSEEEMDEMFDPSALLVVLDALIELTEGVGVDPQTGSFL